jgi:CDP-diacylglycerol--glycerol-3-phosphate 3-phosphatidyltransferase
VNYASFNIPLFLTGVRLVISPLLPFLLVLFLPSEGSGWNITLGLLFIILGFTDFLDGYLARRYQQETILGKLLDPVADKFLVFSTAIALVYLQKIFFYWAIIVIARDVFVMGLREVSLSYGFSVPVSWQGKLKTALQFIYLAVVIMNPYHLYEDAPLLFSVQYILSVVSLIVTVYSAATYYQDFYNQYLIFAKK